MQHLPREGLGAQADVQKSLWVAPDSHLEVIPQRTARDADSIPGDTSRSQNSPSWRRFDRQHILSTASKHGGVGLDLVGATHVSAARCSQTSAVRKSAGLTHKALQRPGKEHLRLFQGQHHASHRSCLPALPCAALPYLLWYITTVPEPNHCTVSHQVSMKKKARRARQSSGVDRVTQPVQPSNTAGGHSNVLCAASTGPVWSQ